MSEGGWGQRRTGCTPEEEKEIADTRANERRSRSRSESESSQERRARGLSPLAADTARELDVLRHDGHALRVDRAQVRVLEQAHQVRLARLLHATASMEYWITSYVNAVRANNYRLYDEYNVKYSHLKIQNNEHKPAQTLS